jgi:hypothetical protein
VANGQTVEYDGKPIVFYASTPEEAEDTKLPRIVHDFGLGQPNAFSARSVLTPPAHTTTTSDTSGRQAYNIRDITSNTIVRAFMANNRQEAIQKFHDFRASQGGDNLGHYRLEAADENGESTADQSAVAADGSQQATAINGVPMWAIYRISDGEVVHRFADHVSSHTRTALSWLRDQNYENPTMLFRVRAMSQSEMPLRGSTHDIQMQRTAQQPEQGPETWEVFDVRNGTVWSTFQANSIEQAEDLMDRQIRHANLNPDHFDARIHRPNREPQQRHQSFTGEWKIVNSNTGEELHRFGGVGNVQADANRVAARWVQQSRIDDPVDVLPVMGDA